MIKMLMMNCNLLFYMFNALCFLVGVELAVSVSFIHFISFIQQTVFSCVKDRYLFVCVYCRLSRKNLHSSENFIIVTHPCVIPNPYDFLSELLFSMKIDGDLSSESNSEHLCLCFTEERK